LDLFNARFGESMRISNKVLAIMFLLVAPWVCAEKLNLSQHRMTLGGQAQITYDSNNVKQFGIFAADMNMSYGYFVLDNFSVGFNIEVGGNFNATPEYREAFGPSILYAFDTNSIASPYVEFGAGITGRQAGAQRWGVGLRPAFGVLLGLNNSVALDLGVSSKFDFAFSGEPKQTTIKAAVGHLGVRVFF